jgi:predicted nuclease of predicted toxin-antitoxin system
MKLSTFNFLADENIHPQVIKFLSDKNFNIRSVFDYQLNGKSDEIILQKSFEENRVILTHDADFGKIIFSQKSTFIGIIYLRTGHIDATSTIASLEKLEDSNLDYQLPFIAVVENRLGKIILRLRNIIYGD